MTIRSLVVYLENVQALHSSLGLQQRGQAGTRPAIVSVDQFFDVGPGLGPDPKLDLRAVGLKDLGVHNPFDALSVGPTVGDPGGSSLDDLLALQCGHRFLKF
ncbi:MAG: hypothetical protein V3U30_02710, partial [Thermoplasmata archaeon]